MTPSLTWKTCGPSHSYPSQATLMLLNRQPINLSIALKQRNVLRYVHGNELH
jgi:hypothetical protein